jgi:hypothetical protein
MADYVEKGNQRIKLGDFQSPNVHLDPLGG